MGVTGKALYQVCKEREADVWYTDKEYQGLDKFIPEQEVIESNQNFDLILKSPGVPWKDQLAFFRNSETLVLGELEVISLLSDVPIIAITGSNGKTTVCTMLKMAFDLLGRKVFLGGNIGNAYSNILNDEYEFSVIEASSFQLELLSSFKPRVGVILNITPHHLERYKDIEEYKKAKFEIFKNMKESDDLIICPQLFKEVHANCRVHERSKSNLDFTSMKVLGEHNKKNFIVVHDILDCLGLDTSVMSKLIESFYGVEHRIEFLGSIGKTKYFNDSKSTSLEATLTAIKSFTDKSKIQLLLGGKLRSDDVSEFKEILEYISKEQIFLYGESKNLLKEVFNISGYSEMGDIFNENKFKEGDIVLFSPGFPSYDQFQNFEKRGMRFKELFSEKLKNYKA